MFRSSTAAIKTIFMTATFTMFVGTAWKTTCSRSANHIPRLAPQRTLATATRRSTSMAQAAVILPCLTGITSTTS
jgi:hypothetical protein